MSLRKQTLREWWIPIISPSKHEAITPKWLPKRQSKSKSTTYHCRFETKIKLFASRKWNSLVLLLLPGITTPWYLEVGHVTLSGSQWGPLLMLDGVQDGECAGQGSVWTAYDLGKSCVRQTKKGKALYRHPMEPCSTPLSVEDGAGYSHWACSVNGLRDDYTWSVTGDTVIGHAV